MTAHRKVIGLGAQGQMKPGTVFADSLPGRGSWMKWNRLIYRIFDTFTGPTNTNLSDHQPEISPNNSKWTDVNLTGGATNPAASRILDNRARFSLVGGGGVVIDTGLTDFEVRAVVNLNVNAIAGIVCRLTGTAGNAVAITMREGSDVANLRVYTNGTAADSANFPATFDANSDHNVIVRVEGNLYTLWVDGTQIFSLTESAHASNTMHGMCGLNVNLLFDDFALSPINSNTPRPI